MNLSDADKQVLLRLARETLQHHIPLGTIPVPGEPQVPYGPILRAPGAAFVTLTRSDDGSLRGCIGEVLAIQPLYASVILNAMHAALRDPRFEPVQPYELSELHIEISVLTPPRTVDSFTEIEVGRHGIMLSKQRCRAVFLPQVATEQGWDLATTLDHLAQKAGLPPNGWREGTSFQVFEAIVFGEERS